MMTFRRPLRSTKRRSAHARVVLWRRPRTAASAPWSTGSSPTVATDRAASSSPPFGRGVVGRLSVSGSGARLRRPRKYSSRAPASPGRARR